jgi:hypothetical protein
MPRGRPKKNPLELKGRPKKETQFGLQPGTYALLKIKVRGELLETMEEMLASDILPNVHEDPMVKVYDNLCERMREKQDYYLPIGLSPWQVRQTIMTIKQLGTDVERNVILRTLLSETVKSIIKVLVEHERGLKEPGND